MKKVLFFICLITCHVSAAQSVGGSVGSSTTVCSGTNSGLLTLSGHSGNVIRWQSSTTNGASWTNISNTTINLVYSNLTSTTWYRAEVLLLPSPPNVSAYSSHAIITVDAASSGIVSSSASVCEGANSGILTLTGSFTNVAGWDSSTNAGANWFPIANTTTTQNYSNLTTTTLYRATVTNGTCTSVSASPATITVNPVSVGGSISGTATVCANSNNGTLILSGHVGNIIRWQSSDDGGASWSNISNTTSTYNFSNLEETTQYRAVIQSGNCTPINSSSAVITVDPSSIGGSVSSPTTVCSGINNGVLTLNGHTGDIIRWENSTNNGSIWAPIANTTNNNIYNNLTTTTAYRAVVKSGGCLSATSSSVSITVSPPSAGGTIAGDDTVCSGSNSGTLSLSGHTGNIVRWQSSDDGGVSWSNITNTTTTYNFSNLTETTEYRAVLQSGNCITANSASAVITVTPVSIGGEVSSDATVCSGTNYGILELSEHTGSIIRWESSTNNGSTWTTIANATSQHIYNNLTASTLFRAVVKSGNCTQANSTPASITVSAPSVGGTVAGADTVCSGSNSGILTLSGYTGNVVRWQSSDDGGLSWSNITSTTGLTTYSYSNITTTTNFRAVVQNGICPTDNSSFETVTVLPVSVGGTLSPSSYLACSGINNGTILLSGQSGNILRWESSVDGGITWAQINNTSDTQPFNNLSTTTLFRALVQQGQCTPAYSGTSAISVFPITAGGSITGSDTVCTGTNSGILSLSSHTGTILNWELSKNGGVTWTNISNASYIYNYSNLITTTLYRAVLQSGSCATATSSTATITVNPISVGGNVFSNTSVCDSSTSGTLTLSGHTGNILNWNSSIDAGNTWASIPNTSNILLYSGITTETMYRATVQSPACTSANSTPATISLAIPATASYTYAANNQTAVFTNTSTSNGGTSLWNFGDNTTSPVTSPAHTYTANGSYTVQLIISDSCGSDTTIQTVVITGVGINESYNNPNVNVYPNPFNNRATISFESKSVSGLKIVNLFGKEVRHIHVEKDTQTLQLEREGLPAGLYFYKLQESDKTIATGKIVIH